MLQHEPLYSYESSVRKRTSHGGEGEEKTDSQVTRTSIQETLKLSHINSNHLYDTKNPEDIQSIKIRHNEWLAVQRLLQPKTIGELHNIYTAWYKINPVDIELIDITLALATDRRIPGDPVWGNIVGPAGFWKTGLCRSISGLPEVYPLDVLTDKSLISGLVEKNKETGEREPVAGILKELNGKVLVIKDFTAVLSLRDYKRQAVLSQLRNAYDGYYDSAFGTLKEPIRVEVEFGFIAAVTPIINNYIKTLVTMGPRCLMVRIHDPPRRESARAARENLGKEETMRYQVKEAVSNYVKSLDFSKKIEVSSRIGDSIDALADYTALMRTHVMAKYYGGKMIDHNIPSPEAPTRLSKQLG
jgi:hypothetical protein